MDTSIKNDAFYIGDDWSKLEIVKKKQFISTLVNGHAKQAWEYIVVSKLY